MNIGLTDIAAPPESVAVTVSLREMELAEAMSAIQSPEKATLVQGLVEEWGLDQGRLQNLPVQTLQDLADSLTSGELIKDQNRRLEVMVAYMAAATTYEETYLRRLPESTLKEDFMAAIGNADEELGLSLMTSY